MRMLDTIQQNRTSFTEIPNALRLLRISQKAKQYSELASSDLGNAGLFSSLREGVWMYLTVESLKPFGIELNINQKAVLIDLFSTLRRIYKSADDVYDESPEIRKFIMPDPLSRVTMPLRWNHGGVEKVTHLSPLLEYVGFSLSKFFPDDPDKKENIVSTFESFIKRSVFALVDFEILTSHKQPTWQDCFAFCKNTTGSIGETVGELVSNIIDSDEDTKRTLQTNMGCAALVSQLTDDIRDIPIDLLDNKSPNVIKRIIQKFPSELNVLSGYRQYQTQHISYRIFRQLAPETAAFAKALFLDCIKGLPKNIQRFLEDFYYSLPPLAVTHKDPLNKGWPTDPKSDEKISTFLGRQPNTEPYKLVDFLALKEKPNVTMLIDPGKQSYEIVSQRVKKFINGGGKMVLVGGSKVNGPLEFESTLHSVTEITRDYPDVAVIIFPGDINQIPSNPQGVKGILNYTFILGSQDGNKFENVFPQEARSYVQKTLKKRGIRSISTLYVLCGNNQASVSQVTGIKPLNLEQQEDKAYFFLNMEKWLKDGIACIYLEGGSGSSKQVLPEIVHRAKELIKKYSPQTLLFVGGGINNPEGVSAIKADADCIVIGNHFEKTDAQDTQQFILALKK